MNSNEYTRIILDGILHHAEYLSEHISREQKAASGKGIQANEFYSRLKKSLEYERVKHIKRNISFPINEAVSKAVSELNYVQVSLVEYYESVAPTSEVTGSKKSKSKFSIPVQLIDMVEEAINKAEVQDSGFRLTGKKGAKADLLRVLNALYELNFFADKDNNTNKVQFMKAFGVMINQDFSSYDKDLTQAYRASDETNLEVFQKLMEKTTIERKKRIDKPDKSK